MIGVAAENLQAAFSTLAKLGSDPDVCLVDAVGSVQVKELYLYCEEGEIVIIALRVSAMVQIKLGSNF